MLKEMNSNRRYMCLTVIELKNQNYKCNVKNHLIDKLAEDVRSNTIEINIAK